MEAYDVRLDSWQIIANMNVRRSTLGSAMLGGLIYAVGGFDGSVGLDSVERYNPGQTMTKNCPFESLKFELVKIEASVIIYYVPCVSLYQSKLCHIGYISHVLSLCSVCV